MKGGREKVRVLAQRSNFRNNFPGSCRVEDREVYTPWGGGKENSWEKQAVTTLKELGGKWTGRRARCGKVCQIWGGRKKCR